MLTRAFILQWATIITPKACGALPHPDAVHDSSLDLNVWSKCFVGHFASCAAIFQNFLLVALQDYSPVLFIFFGNILSGGLAGWDTGHRPSGLMSYAGQWIFYFISFHFTLPQSWQASPSLADWPVCTASRRLPHSARFLRRDGKTRLAFLLFTKGQCCCLRPSPPLNISTTTFHRTFCSWQMKFSSAFKLLNQQVENCVFFFVVCCCCWRLPLGWRLPLPAIKPNMLADRWNPPVFEFRLWKWFI